MGIFDFGRRFINGLPIVGGITSNLWGDPGQENMQQAFAQAQQEMAKNRAYQMDGRMNAMNQSALAFGPRNDMLGQMMGKQGPAMDMAPMLQNPMPQQQQQDIRDAAFGPKTMAERIQQHVQKNAVPQFDPRTLGGPYNGRG